MKVRAWSVAAVFVGVALGAPQDVAQGSAEDPRFLRAGAPARAMPGRVSTAGDGSVPVQAMQVPDDGLDFDIRSRIVAAPSYVRGRVRLAPRPAQVVLRVTVEAAGYSRTTEVGLVGRDAPVDCHFYWRDLPPGLYDMVATVHGAGGTVLSRRRRSFAVVDGRWTAAEPQRPI